MEYIAEIKNVSKKFGDETAVRERTAGIRALFLKLKEEGVTILLASHHREDIEELCDEVYEMEDGRLRSVSVFGLSR